MTTLSVLDKEVVDIFLKTARKEIDNNNVYFIGYRDVLSNGKKVNAMQALLDIGIVRKEDIWNYIKTLTSDDCFRISRDYDFKRDYNSEIFEFKKFINRKLVYIKLTINNKGLLCLSFHLDNGGVKNG